jgi:hypothetical protein
VAVILSRRTAAVENQEDQDRAEVPPEYELRRTSEPRP